MSPHWLASNQGNGERAVALAISEVRSLVERAFAQQDVLDACARRDLGTIITILNAHGVTQGRIAELTGITQGRLSEWARHKRVPRASSTFESFADGLGVPSAARQALGLAPASPLSGMSLVPAQRTQEPVVGLVYPATPMAAAENVSALWQADLDDLGLLDRGLLTPAAWNEASLRWLVGPAAAPNADGDAQGGVRIGMGDVERFRDTVGMFQQLDDRFGGGHARHALVQYLQADALRLLRGRYREAVGRVVHSAVAEATLLLAWMTYDAAPHSPQAQRYYIQALGLAQAGGDRLLGAGILDAMSHQATFIGRFEEAANLARAARTGTTGLATSTLTAHFHTMEARALARLGDARGCELALAAAVTQHERRKPEDDPGWFQYFDEAELSAEFGHCLRDLNRPEDATEYAGRSLGVATDGQFVRSDFFAAMVLADAHLAAGDVEQACDTALAALTAGEQLRSGRCVNYLREFNGHLAAASATQAVRDFSEQAAQSRLWRIAARPSKPDGIT
jgi:transcriptional regulator with XRE-family HTH domain